MKSFFDPDIHVLLQKSFSLKTSEENVLMEEKDTSLLPLWSMVEIYTNSCSI